MSVYEKKELIKQTFFQKLFKILPKENYIIELQNFLSEHEDDIMSCKNSEIEKLRTKYKVKKYSFLEERKYLLDKYITFCLWDEKLSDDEKSILSFLTKLLEISEEYLTKRLAEEGKVIYEKKVKMFVSDGKLDKSEEEQLDEIQKQFNITDSDSTNIYGDEAKLKIQNYVNELLRKRRISPKDETVLNDMISGLNVTVTFTGDGISKFRKYWDVENAELLPIESDIKLQNSETLYFVDNIDWYEERSRTKTVSYAGLTSSFKICKGLSFRTGVIAPSRISEDYMKLIDSGKVYFTNKRIIFMGNHSNKIIPYSKILSFTPFDDGIEIGKDSGKHPFFKYNDSELMGLYLSRLLKDF